MDIRLEFQVIAVAAFYLAIEDLLACESVSAQF
jgi:hypothetical protein